VYGSRVKIRKIDLMKTSYEDSCLSYTVEYSAGLTG
jgi:hypothetical protein